jgi:hypothetical protein
MPNVASHSMNHWGPCRCRMGYASRRHEAGSPRIVSMTQTIPTAQSLLTPSSISLLGSKKKAPRHEAHGAWGGSMKLSSP